MVASSSWVASIWSIRRRPSDCVRLLSNSFLFHTTATEKKKRKLTTLTMQRVLVMHGSYWHNSTQIMCYYVYPFPIHLPKKSFFRGQNLSLAVLVLFVPFDRVLYKFNETLHHDSLRTPTLWTIFWVNIDPTYFLITISEFLASNQK